MILLASPSLSDAATLTGSSAQTGAPVTYLQRMQPGEIWASSGLSGVYLQADLGASETWDTIWLGFHNGTREATYRVRSSTSSGTLTSAPAFDTGQALKLDGASQYASQGSLTSATSAGVLEGWIRPRSLASAPAIFATGATTGYVEVLAASGADDQIVVNYSGGTLESAAGACALMEWVHVAVVWSGSTVQLYIGGALTDSATNFAAFSGNVTVTLGFESPTDYFFGDLDEVRYWTVSRTAAQILANMYGPVTTPTTGLVGYWKLDGAATNAGSAGGSITLTGAPGYVNREPMWCSPSLDDYDRRHALLFLGSPGYASTSRSERYVRIDIDDPSGDSGDGIQAGRLYISRGYQPSGHRYPVEPFSLFDPSQTELMPGGQTMVSPFGVRPSAGFTIQTDSEAEMLGQLYPILRTRGASRDVLFVADPDPGPYRFAKTTYGLLQSRTGAVVPAFNLYQTQIQITGLE